MKKTYRPTRSPLKNTKEEDVHRTICLYVKAKYPDVIFMSDGSGLKLPMGLAKKYASLKSSRGIPDLFIAEPKGKYGGLFIEIKNENVVVFNKDGTLRKDEHLIEQAKVLDELKKKGYASYFAIGAKMAIEIIDDYMKL
ncbi:MAG: hypothetical protein R3345_06950 [Fulvivirga sp.]|nr:hypothetical protein [Fulvivirga sp.]